MGGPRAGPPLSAMNTPAVVLVSIVLSAAAATGVSFALRPGEAPPDTTVPDLQRAVDDLRGKNAALTQQVEQLRKTPAPAAAPASTERAEASLSRADVTAIVDAYIKNLKPFDAAGGGAAAASGKTDFDVDAEFSKLQKSSFFADAALWKRLMASGKIDEAIKKFEELAAANPKDPKAQMELANAYLSQLQLEPAKYDLATKADKSFDAVLAIDDKHWEARFSKAMSYTFWPEFTGKPKEAIAHFEKLVTQQETMPVEESQAQTYLFLGNLLERRDPAKAKEVWQKGLRRHPQNAELTKKLAQ